MGGRPVWLASITKWRGGRILPAAKFTPELEARALDRLRQELHGIGDEGLERAFAMCITTCIHRALSDEETAALPPAFHEAPALDVAGGPLRTIYTRGFSPPVSCQPCERPRKIPLPGDGPGSIDCDGDRLMIIRECGRCAPCRARDACHESACATANVAPRNR